MTHPRIEEVEDSDLDMFDPSEGDIDDFDEADILRPRNAAAAAASAPRPAPGAPARAAPHGGAAAAVATDPKAYAHYHCLYPVYFDAARTRVEGRRVAAALAVRSPLARDIVDACRGLRLPTLFEPEKTHPKDWANPGRVRVAPLRGGGVRNKHQLYLLVAQHLRAHPTGEASAALWERVPGGPPAPQPGAAGYPRPAVPRGWKVGEFLPYYSAAMTGGGVSENMFKDLMREMGGAAGAGGMPGLPGGMDMASLMAAMSGGAPEVEEGAAAGGRKIKEKKKGKGKA